MPLMTNPLMATGQMEMAITHLQKAVQIDPDYLLAIENLEKARTTMEQDKNNR